MPDDNTTRAAQPFAWPRTVRAAVSLTFDDARLTQADIGLDILDRHSLAGSFYILIDTMLQRLPRWRAAIERGHEIGNHTLTHPCTGNYIWSRDRPLELFTLERMEKEFADANEAIARHLGRMPMTFAYPCGQTFVGRAADRRSYVPLVAGHFLAGRAFKCETPNDPVMCDLSCLMAVDADGTSVEQLCQWVDRAIEQGGWIIFAAHEVAAVRQGISPDVLDAFCEYLHSHRDTIWTDTVANIAGYLRDHRR